jgi:hypothetical protein
MTLRTAERQFLPRPITEATRWRFRLQDEGIVGLKGFDQDRLHRLVKRLLDYGASRRQPFSSTGFSTGYQFDFADGSKLLLSLSKIEDR